MHFPKLCWRKSAQCFQESSLVLFLFITSLIRKRKQVVLLKSFYPQLLQNFTPITAQLLIFFIPSEQITPSLLQHLPPLAAQLLIIFTPLNKYPILLHHFTPPPPGSPTPTSFYPFWTNYALTLTQFCLFPPIVAYCCPLLPGKVSQRGWFFKSPPIAAHFYMAILVRG